MQSRPVCVGQSPVAHRRRQRQSCQRCLCAEELMPVLPWGRSLHASRSRTCTDRSVACRTEHALLLRLTALCPRSRAQVETWFVGSSSRLRAESTLLLEARWW